MTTKPKPKPNTVADGALILGGDVEGCTLDAGVIHNGKLRDVTIRAHVGIHLGDFSEGGLIEGPDDFVVTIRPGGELLATLVRNPDDPKGYSLIVDGTSGTIDELADRIVGAWPDRSQQTMADTIRLMRTLIGRWTS